MMFANAIAQLTSAQLYLDHKKYERTSFERNCD
jgi:hypothetical protein